MQWRSSYVQWIQRTFIHATYWEVVALLIGNGSARSVHSVVGAGNKYQLSSTIHALRWHGEPCSASANYPLRVIRTAKFLASCAKSCVARMTSASSRPTLPAVHSGSETDRPRSEGVRVPRISAGQWI